MSRRRPGDSPPVVAQPKADPVLAVVDFEPGRLALRPRDVIRYTLYGLVIVALAATTAYLVASRGERIYGARTEILFERRTEQSTGFLREDRNLTTQLVTLRSRAILGPVAKANGLSVNELAEKLEVGIVESSEIIRVQVNDRSTVKGMKLVGAITKRYLPTAESPAPGETKRFLEGERATIDRDLQARTVRSAQLEAARLGRATPVDPTPLPNADQTLVDAEIKSLLDKRTEVDSRLEAATVDFINRPRVAQITKPYKLDAPVSPKPLNAAAAGGLAGAVIAAITVAVLARRRGPSARSA